MKYLKWGFLNRLNLIVMYLLLIMNIYFVYIIYIRLKYYEFEWENFDLRWVYENFDIFCY